jgi:hypothetical protein
MFTQDLDPRFTLYLVCPVKIFEVYIIVGHAVAQLVEALCYKSEGRGFDSSLCHWNFSLT